MVAVPAPEVCRASAHRVRLPLANPHVAAHGAELDREVVLVALTATDGTVGWGECSTLADPSYTSEYTAGAWRMIVERLLPALLADETLRTVGHRAARWAIDTALADLAARASASSLRDLWAGSAGARSRVPSTAVIGIERRVDQIVGRVAGALEAGHRSVKLKIDQSWNVEPLAAVRDAWPDLDLAADANGTLLAGDDRCFAALDSLNLTYVEQPLAADDLTGHAALAARFDTPIVLDESVTGVGVVDTIAALGAARGVNAKPGRLGREAVAVARAAHRAGFEVLCGGMLETGLGRAAALAVAALPEFTLAADLGPSSSYFAADLTEPFELDANGMLEVPDGPGLGVAPDAARLDAATVERVDLAR